MEAWSAYEFGSGVLRKGIFPRAINKVKTRQYRGNGRAAPSCLGDLENSYDSWCDLATWHKKFSASTDDEHISRNWGRNLLKRLSTQEDRLWRRKAADVNGVHTVISDCVTPPSKNTRGRR